ncbi:hypothetical protein Vadar_022561 [Vaccinium darrowii]|uniref:Uncharacterized protein n=1 Tax=Vaccinium darrowii TaxID=229202 RepID=A0ACB7Z5M2_9ERIC|nr:hypothetical protein Vadar_022561 [Vaccinium darrowii]
MKVRNDMNMADVCWMVDEKPIRVFNNNEAIGVPFPNTQAMNIYSSIWCGDDWATEGGRVKTDWSQAPFTASFSDFELEACEYSSGSSSCASSQSTNSITKTEAWQAQALDELLWMQDNCMVYDYCTDYSRFPDGMPAECNQPRFLQ